MRREDRERKAYPSSWENCDSVLFISLASSLFGLSSEGVTTNALFLNVTARTTFPLDLGPFLPFLSLGESVELAPYPEGQLGSSELLVPKALNSLPACCFPLLGWLLSCEVHAGEHRACESYNKRSK